MSKLSQYPGRRGLKSPFFPGVLLGDPGGRMSRNERIVFEKMMKYLEKYSKKLPKTQQEWDAAANDIIKLCEELMQHPLAVKLGAAVYEYIEEKEALK